MAIFTGRAYDAAEKLMPATSVTTGGRIEHEVFIWERVIVLVIEVKLDLCSAEIHHNQLAQVMCELDGTFTSVPCTKSTIDKAF